MLVRIGRVVFLGHVVTDKCVRQCLESMRVMSRDIDRRRVVLTDIVGEHLVGRAVEDDDACRADDASEEIVLPLSW